MASAFSHIFRRIGLHISQSSGKPPANSRVSWRQSTGAAHARAITTTPPGPSSRPAALPTRPPLVAALIAEAALDRRRPRRASPPPGPTWCAASAPRASPGLMEVFLAEYGLSTDEGIALMCLAEALLRVPDAETMDALIEDKIAPSDWGRASWPFGLEPGQRLDLGADADRQGAGRPRAGRRRPPARRGEAAGRAGDPHRRRPRDEGDGPPVRAGRDHRRGDERAARDWRRKGYTYSYDMLGEAARTEADARRYHLAYSKRDHRHRRGAAKGSDIRANPGISVKLSALHPRYEVAKRARVMAELVPRVRALARAGQGRGPGLQHRRRGGRPAGPVAAR